MDMRFDPNCFKSPFWKDLQRFPERVEQPIAEAHHFRTRRSFLGSDEKIADIQWQHGLEGTNQPTGREIALSQNKPSKRDAGAVDRRLHRKLRERETCASARGDMFGASQSEAFFPSRMFALSGDRRV